MVLLSATPALAINEPQLISTFPVHDGFARSSDVAGVTATYDRDINGLTSRIKLFDGTGAEVGGVSDLAGPQSDTGGKRTIKFTPYASLTEAASPYKARAHVYPLAPGGDTLTIWTFTIDDTAPAPPVITYPTTGSVIDDQPVVVNGSTESGAFVSIVEATTTIATDRANSLGAFSIALPYPIEDGVAHTITAVAVDVAGNRSTDSTAVTFVHDSIEVTPEILTPAQNAHLNTASVVVSGTAKPNTTLTVRKGAAPVGSTVVNASGNWTVTIGFPAGTHVITAEAFDGTNTDGPSAARTFTVDLIAPPAPVIISPSAGASVASTGVTVTGTAEADTFVRVREGTLQLARVPSDSSGNWSATITFAQGSHTITATGEDLAGNIGPASPPRTFTVDTVAPAAPTITQPVQGAFLATSSVTVAGAAEANATVRITEGTVLIALATASNSGTWSVVIPFADGTHAIVAAVVDAAGNTGPASPARSFTVDTLAPDAPVITQPAQGAFLTWPDVAVGGTGEPGTTVTVYEGLTAIGSALVNGASNWSVTITFANGAHAITAQAADLAGNTGPGSATRSFTMSAPTDALPPPAPIITDPAPGSYHPAVTIFRGTAEPGTTVRVIEGGELGSATADALGDWTFAATLAAGGHTVTAFATDPAGNAGPFSPPRSFVVDATRPTVAFTTSGGTIVLPGQAVSLSGTASDNIGVQRVELEIDDIRGQRVADPVTGCTGCPAAAVTWAQTLTLGPGIYTVRAYAVDRAGNRSFPDTISIYVL